MTSKLTDRMTLNMFDDEADMKLLSLIKNYCQNQPVFVFGFNIMM